MKSGTIALLLAVLVPCVALSVEGGTGPSVGQGPVWLTSLHKAKAEAGKSAKPILIDFTGSDWCGWCIRLKKEVFSKPEFRKWAATKVVLLEVDFPKRKRQHAQTKKRNSALARQYGVRGLPTIVFINAAGKELGRSGYMRGGPKAWTANADQILASAKRSK